MIPSCRQLALLLVIPAAKGLPQAAAWEAPEVAGIAVTGREARFIWQVCGEDCDATRRWSGWSFDRITGRWSTIPPRRQAPLIPAERKTQQDVKKRARLTSAHTLTYGPAERNRFVFTLREAGRPPLPLVPVAGERERWRVLSEDPMALRYMEAEIPALSRDVTTWQVTPDAIWFGLDGSSSAPGGLVRFDRHSRKIEPIVDPLVSTKRVIGIAATSRAIWVAAETSLASTGRPGGGLLRYDRTRHEWTSRTSRNSPLPDDDVARLEASGDTLFIATRAGVAVLDDATNRWNTRYVHLSIVEGTILEDIPGSGHTDEDGIRRFDSATRPVLRGRWSLAATRQADAERERAILALAGELRPVPPESEFAAGWLETVIDPDSMIAMLRSVPNEHFAAAWRDGELDVEAALAHPRLARLAAATIHEDQGANGWNEGAVAALGHIGDASVLPHLRRMASEGIPTPALAFALARMGDTTGRALLRQWVLEGVSGYAPETTIERLVQLGDSVVERWLEVRARDSASARSYQWLRRVATRAQWQQALRDAISRPAAGAALIDAVTDLPIDSVAPDRETRTLLSTLAVRVFLEPRTSSSSYAELVAPVHAAEVMVKLRDPSVIAPLIAAMTGDQFMRASATLVQITGVDSAPGFPTQNESERRAAKAFWATWWREHEGGFVAVPRSVGAAALRRWRAAWASD